MTDTYSRLMRIFRHYTDLPSDARDVVVAIGNFDGVHKGHQEVINEAGTIARAMGVPWAVLTFEPHPTSVFKPDSEPFRLTTMRTKVRVIEEMGVDQVLVQHFDKEFASLDADGFIQKVLLDGLGARHVVSGYDFEFGKGRGGNPDLLLKRGREKGFGFTAVPKVTDAAGEVYSSTRVRNELKAANPRAAAEILGTPFEIEGRVEHGDARGRELGYPTANLTMGDYLHPATGIYAVQAGIDEGLDTKWMDGAGSFGYRPQFGGKHELMEVYLFDFDDDLYGKNMRVRLIEYLRPEMKFDGLDELKAQIADDCVKVREILAKASPLLKDQKR